MLLFFPPTLILMFSFRPTTWKTHFDFVSLHVKKWFYIKVVALKSTCVLPFFFPRPYDNLLWPGPYGQLQGPRPYELDFQTPFEYQCLISNQTEYDLKHVSYRLKNPPVCTSRHATSKMFDENTKKHNDTSDCSFKIFVSWELQYIACISYIHIYVHAVKCFKVFRITNSWIQKMYPLTQHWATNISIRK